MRHSFVAAAIAALVSSVVAQTSGFDAITSPTQDQKLPAGKPFDIIWEPGSVTGTITISLLQGSTPSTLSVGPVVAAGIDNALGKYTYNVPSVSSFATYGFKIVLDSTAKDPSPTFQYSFPFHIVDGSSAGSSASGSATGAPSTTTVQLSTGPSFTSSSAPNTSTSSTVSLSTRSATSTRSAAPTTLSNSTLSTISTPTGSGSSPTAGSPTAGGSSKNSTTSPPGPVPSNGAASIATGGMALVGGLVLAFAL